MTYNLNELFININNKLKSGKELKELKYLLDEYKGNDWEDFIEYNNEKYIKKVAFKNELFELVIISWNKNQSSPIHDHPKNGCLLKILKGNLIEEKYEKMYKINENNLKINNISYIEGKEIIHKIINKNDKSVSLHVYSPPKYIPKIYD